jgi:hypothetical protein
MSALCLFEDSLHGTCWHVGIVGLFFVRDWLLSTSFCAFPCIYTQILSELTVHTCRFFLHNLLLNL